MLIISISMIGFAFYYLDQNRHQISCYALYYNDRLSGFEKIDRYRLEDSLIYKSISEFPRALLDKKILRRISFDMRGKDFINYKKELLNNGSSFIIQIANNTGKISFVASGHSDFSFHEKIPVFGNDLCFEKEAMVSYPPILKRYNFKKRGEQFVNVIEPTSGFLPPCRDTISIKPIGKDTVEIEGKDIQCERMALNLGNGDFISVWVTKNFHNVIMVEIPKIKFKSVFCSQKKNIPVEKYRKESPQYFERNVIFHNDDIELRGTLTIPAVSSSPYPAVLLVGGPGPIDRDALGIFTDIADALAQSGYCVFRSDKRGIGKSQGFYSAYSQVEHLSDLKQALEFLKIVPEVDPSQIAILGHSDGGFYASHLAGTSEDVRACILLSALSSLSPIDNDYKMIIRAINDISPNDEEYRDTSIESINQSRDIAQGKKSDWITVLDTRVFIKKILQESKYNPLEAIKKVKVPILILHGRQDKISPIEGPQSLSKVLSDSKNDNFTTIYFGELGHYFGKLVQSPPVEDHYEVDREVLESIVSWLRTNLKSEEEERIELLVEEDELFKDADSGIDDVESTGENLMAPIKNDESTAKEVVEPKAME
ncbi:MAG: alpha/beta fold hydrolase [Candidatus Omnitrophica bacterium]|nr:alpha/beta fold hydrolase [Candidatus Omnitrophota bacterium]